MKKGFKDNIEKATQDNEAFRHVLYTSAHLQLVVMTLLPGQEIGLETHQDNDQFFRFEQGTGKVLIGETTYDVSDGDAVIVPAGTQHNVMNASHTEPLKLYTLYTPPHHKDGTIRATKEEAEADAPEFDGVTTE
jgi:mannose-6-phosphate isomerase-like protein (cupin superfamily)